MDTVTRRLKMPDNNLYSRGLAHFGDSTLFSANLTRNDIYSYFSRVLQDGGVKLGKPLRGSFIGKKYSSRVTEAAPHVWAHLKSDGGRRRTAIESGGSGVGAAARSPVRRLGRRRGGHRRSGGSAAGGLAAGAAAAGAAARPHARRQSARRLSRRRGHGCPTACVAARSPARLLGRQRRRLGRRRGGSAIDVAARPSARRPHARWLGAYPSCSVGRCGGAAGAGPRRRSGGGLEHEHVVGRVAAMDKRARNEAH